MAKKARNNLAISIREARKKRGYKTIYAAAMGVNYSPEVVGRHERGTIVPSVHQIICYADKYNAPELCRAFCDQCVVKQKIREDLERLAANYNVYDVFPGIEKSRSGGRTPKQPRVYS